MQRDTFAILVKKKGLPTIPINILQLSGEITHEHIFHEVFDGYKARRIALMTNMSGVDPSRGPLLPRDIIINSFEKLSKVHMPHLQYKLLPLLCTDMVTFSCLQGICASPRSPFRIENRREPRPIKAGWANPKSPLRDYIWGYYEQKMTSESKSLPREMRGKLPCGNSLDWDGLLITGKHVGLLQMRSSVTQSILDEYAAQIELFHSRTFKNKIANCTNLFIDICDAPNKHHFLGVSREIERCQRAPLIQFAKKNDINLYEMRADGEFYFVGG
eukprot:Tbor_TRINITY_DN3428_c0_g1::TRINITY_DN3428_c0_g1_i1::g.3743::m.3743